MRGFHKLNLNGFSQPAIQWKQPEKAHDIEKHAMLITSTLGQKRDGVAYPYQAYWDKLIERVRERLRNSGVSIYKYRDHRTNEFVVRAQRRRRR